MPDAALKIPCPKCGSVLKLPGRKYLGKVGKCPACSHKFKLTEPEPEAVELELDESPVTFAPAELSAPPEPTSPPSGPTGFPIAAEPAGSVLSQRKRAKKRKRTPEIVVGVLSALALGGIAWYLVPALNRAPAAPRQATEQVREERAAAKVAEVDGFAAAGALIGGADGEPIALRGMPAGVSLLVHLRPAELWGPRWASTREATGPLAGWAAAELEALTGYPPAALEECTIGWVLGPRGSTPKPCATFTFVQRPKRSDLVLNLPGTRTDDYAVPLQIGDGKAYLVLDDPADPAGNPVGMAVAPAEYAAELTPDAALTAPSVEGLLPATDRAAPLTVLFQPLDLDLHRDTLFAESLRPVADAVREAFGGWSEAAAVAFGPAAGDADGGGDGIGVTLAVRGTTDDVASTLGRTAGTELSSLPETLLAHVRTLRPATAGRQRLIGRLPAMLAATIDGRVGGAEGRVYRAAAKLPEVAGPNLALASLLTWDAGLTGPAAAPAVAAAPADTATLAEKLDRELEIDFRRTPLQEAFGFIAGEAGFPLEIDGGAIRDAGLTQNIPQEFALGRVSARAAIGRILEGLPKLAVVADAPSPGTLLVTTRDAAAANGLTVLELP